MNKILRFLYILFALLFLGLAVMGVVLPVLPTTPFLLLASFFAAKSSEKLNLYIKSTKMYQQHAVNFIEHKGMTLSMKVMILTFASTMLMFPLYFSKSIILKMFIMLLMVVKYTYFIFFLNTVEKERVSYD